MTDSTIEGLLVEVLNVDAEIVARHTEINRIHAWLSAGLPIEPGIRVPLAELEQELDSWQKHRETLMQSIEKLRCAGRRGGVPRTSTIE
ncbi:hypothetical protein [Paraburkholderia phosphatilytica]|uniref:hypothetical protein n=1 Tax=Paraburkholderia phosphatilytica TaxID=2282883 RepID=UPI000E485494|nr:hypothetical protein [Paraburkholderia phosphatilytica]